MMKKISLVIIFLSLLFIFPKNNALADNCSINPTTVYTNTPFTATISNNTIQAGTTYWVWVHSNSNGSVNPVPSCSNQYNGAVCEVDNITPTQKGKITFTSKNINNAYTTNGILLDGTYLFDIYIGPHSPQMGPGVCDNAGSTQIVVGGNPPGGGTNPPSGGANPPVDTSGLTCDKNSCCTCPSGYTYISCDQVAGQTNCPVCRGVGTDNQQPTKLAACNTGFVCDNSIGCVETSFDLPSPSPQPCKAVGAGSSIEYNCDTAVGNILTSPKDFVQTMMGLILSVVGGVAIILIILSGYRLIISQGNPENIKNAKEQLTAAIIGLLFIIFSLVILQIIGVNILGLPGFN
jgi:hypothetical protein